MDCDIASYHSSKYAAIDQLRILPSECRQRGLTYAGNLRVGLEIKVNGQRIDVLETVIGRVPVMLRSTACHLSKMNRKELLKAGEEGTEKGGYFICKGSEKGLLFTEYGVMMRCVKDNHTAVMMTIHYLESGTVQVALQGECAPETPDNPQFQEAAVSGHIILLIIRERMENILGIVRRKLEYNAKRKKDSFVLTSGAFFTEMRTTDVRKLRPEAWGFICPVHTPDGSPCGLLNHLTASCRIVTHYSDTRDLPAFLTDLGMISFKSIAFAPVNEKRYPVFLDGRFLGYIPVKKAAAIERQLRCIKTNLNDSRVPCVAE
ncbi:RNA polymerase Rpb2, domain 3, partial [Ostertagia ostertagi]